MANLGNTTILSLRSRKSQLSRRQARKLATKSSLFDNNPWWAEPGEPEDVPEIIRDYAIDELRKQLPKGYSIEDETIINPCNNDYLKETIKRLQDIVKHPDKITSHPYPLGWWKTEVCQFHNTLICYRTEDS